MVLQVHENCLKNEDEDEDDDEEMKMETTPDFDAAWKNLMERWEKTKSERKLHEINNLH